MSVLLVELYHFLIFLSLSFAGPLLSKGQGGFLLPGLVGTWAAALMTSMLGLAAPEVTQLAEEVVEAAKQD